MKSINTEGEMTLIGRYDIKFINAKHMYEIKQQ